MNSRKLLFSLFAMFALILLIGSSIAVQFDPRYRAYWELDNYLQQEMDPDSNWSWFSPAVPPSGHPTRQRFGWSNLLAEYAGKSWGFYEMMIHFYPIQHFKLSELEIFVNCYLATYSPEGFTFKITGDDYQYHMHVWFSRTDGEGETIYFEVPWETESVVMKVRLVYSNEYDKWSGSAKAYARKKSNGLMTLKGTLYANNQDASFSASTRMKHEVDADYGMFGSYVDWYCTAIYYSGGLRPDVAFEDLKCDISDISNVNANYGKSLAVMGAEEWYWGATTNPCWKSDCNADCLIDTSDMTYIISQYGWFY